MLASYQWLRSLVPQLTASPEEVAARLTSAGLEVEGFTAYGAGSESCIIARVVSMRPHPNRANLRLVTVDRGGGAAHEELVCGAPNVPDPGGLVVLAPLGTHLPAKGLTLEKKAIGGIESAGMLVSESELGLSEDHDGIIVLPPDFAQPGTRFSEAVPEARDTIFSIGVTPNRPDALGHVGVAREVAALFGFPWAPPEPKLPPPPACDDVTTLDSLVKVRIDDGERCAHYGTALSLGVTIRPSPLGIRYRLSALGVRPISNVVDVTNIVMLEFGHPLHAFDLDLVRGAEIIVRRARPGETMRTLDDKEHQLTDDDLIIGDAQGPTGLAGVMGGANSEIRETTRRVLIECAYFDARSVRRTSRRHGFHTEASHRFERGVDPGDTRAVLTRAAALMQELGGGTVLSDVRLTTAREIPAAVVRLRLSRVDQLIGVHVAQDEVTGILRRLGFLIDGQEGDTLVLKVPTHRPDVTREVDVIDDIARIRGLETLPAVLPPMHPRLDVGGQEEAVRRARAAAVELGLSEALTFRFIARRSLEAVGAPAPALTVANPMSERESVMRTSLLPGLFEAVSRASRHGEHDVRMFAIGPVFLAAPPSDKAPPAEERLTFAAVISGDRPSYLTKPVAFDVWDAKGVALGWLARITGGREVTSVRAEEGERPHHLHPRGAAFLLLDGERVGNFGPVHPDVADAFEMAQGALAIEIDLAKVLATGRREPQYVPIPRFPASVRDLAVVVPDGVAAGEVERAVREAAGALGEHVTLFDRYVGGGVPAGHASLAFRIVYRVADRTLTDAEVDVQHTKAIETVQARFGATLRA